MLALVCEISWRPFYRGEEDGYASTYMLSNSNDKTNFINFNGHYYGCFEGTALAQELHHHHEHVDYVIFVARHPKRGSKIVGWYGQATLYRDMQFFDPNEPYFVEAEDEYVVLLDERDRHFSLEIDQPYAWVEIDRRLMNYLKQNKRINYLIKDLNRSVTMPLSSLQLTCEFIEKEIADLNYLQALLIVNRAIMTYGRLASLIYYKAWILYAFLQYKQASYLLFSLQDVPDYHDFSCYMLGNIYFETGEYETSIRLFKEVKQLNPDQTAYMLAQAYAMEKDVPNALKAIDRAISYNSQEIVYRSFKTSLKEWQHASK